MSSYSKGMGNSELGREGAEVEMGVEDDLPLAGGRDRRLVLGKSDSFS